MALAASDPSLDTPASRPTTPTSSILRTQITPIVNNSDFNGVNLIKTGGTNIMALATASGSQITVLAQNLTLGGGNMHDLGARLDQHDCVGAGDGHYGQYRAHQRRHRLGVLGTAPRPENHLTFVRTCRTR